MKNLYKSATCFLTILFTFIGTVLPLEASEKNASEPVKVGYYEDGDYMSRNQYEEYVGYNFEFLQEISKHSGFLYDVIDAVSWESALQMLIDGEIDLLPAVYYTEERAGQMLFSTQPMCNIYTTLNVRPDDQRYNYDDFEAFQGMNVGIISGGIDGENFKAFCQEHGITLKIHEYDETDKLLAALDDGTLDGVAITHLGKNSTFRSVAQFSPSPLYFAVSRQREDVLEYLNRAMNDIMLGNPGYEMDLYDKYLAPSANQKPVFTNEEQDFIREAGTIVASYDPDFAPLSYTEPGTGQFTGVTSDILHFIAESSGLQFRFEAHPQAEALELLEEGNIDVLCVSDGDYLWDRRNHINSTIYFLRTPTAMVTRTGNEKIIRLAQPEGYQLSEDVKKDNPEMDIIYYPSAKACLEAVNSRKADAAFMNTQVASYYLEEEQFNELSAAPLSMYSNDLCVGVSFSADQRLFSIINKCVQYLPRDQIDTSLINYMAKGNQFSIGDLIRQHIAAVIIAICLILGIIIFLISHNLKIALRSNQRIQELLYKDELTGLYNINGFYSKWEELARGKDRGDYALLYSDICQFRLINDHFGFGVGDEVLIGLAGILRKNQCDKELCGRVSADNFVILMKYADWEELLIRLEAILKQLDLWRQEKTGIPYQIGMVYGAYLISPSEETGIQQMMDFSNYARRSAKNNPNHFVMCYDEKMRQQAIFQQELENRLGSALSRGELEVYYQPQVDMETGRIISSEALIRWNHPEKGLLMPGAFIPLFEKNGMVTTVDLWLFEDVCRSMRKWMDQDITVLPVSCNFSRLHFEQPDFPEHLSAIADQYQVLHQLLIVEITESAIIEDPAVIETLLPKLKQKGFLIAIDDFGSGYSSLGQLQQLTADVLKMDRSFIVHGIRAEREQTVVRNLIHLAKELGLMVICEGVEDQEQADILLKLNGRLAQGFYYYRPVKKEEFESIAYSK